MRSTIPRKQVAKNEHFAKAWQNIEQLVSRDEAQALVASTVNDIKLKTAGKTVAYAWSGGKDSLALQYVCEQAGIHRCVFCTSKALEYPAFLQWVYQYHPVGMTTIEPDCLSLQQQLAQTNLHLDEHAADGTFAVDAVMVGHVLHELVELHEFMDGASEPLLVSP